jgi:anti-sigma B factor antagonist
MIFEYNFSRQNNINLFRLSGELIDRNQAKGLLDEIEAGIPKGENKILLNLQELKYVNSSGLNVLLQILTKARKSSGDVAICCVNKKITELLVITKLDSIFNLSADEAKAIEKLNK